MDQRNQHHDRADRSREHDEWLQVTGKPDCGDSTHQNGFGNVDPAEPLVSLNPFRLLFRNAPVPILIHRDGRILDANNAAMQALRLFTRTEVIGKDLLAFVDPESRPAVSDHLGAINEDEQATLIDDVTLISPSGDRLEVTLASSAVHLLGRRVIQTAFYVINRQNQLEEICSLPVGRQEVVRNGADAGTVDSKWRDLFERANIPILIFTPDTERILEANPAACRTYGYERDEIVGLSLKSMTKDVHRGEQEIRRILKYGGVQHFETTHLRKDGVPIELEASCSTIDFGGELAILTFVNDITERKKTERALWESESKFRHLVEESPVGIYINQDNRFAYVNEAFASIFGRTPEEIMALPTLFELIHEDDHALLRRHVRNRLQDKFVPKHYGVRGLRKDGEIVEIEVIGSVIEYQGWPAIIGTILDVTQKRKAEMALRLSEHRYRNLVEQASDGILAAPRGGCFIEANTSACEMTGYSRDELERIGFEDLFPATDEQPAGLDWDSCSDKRTIRLEKLLRRKDGSSFPVEISVRLTNKNVAQAIVRDATERKEYENRLIEARNRAEEMARLKTAFLTNMSHEIRTPLTTIIGFADILADEVDAKDIEFVEFIRQSGRRLMDTLNSVLDLAQLEGNALRLKPEPTDLAEIVRTSYDWFEHQATARGLELTCNVGNGQPAMALVDRGAAVRVLNNLLSNAVKFTPSGSISLSLDTDETHAIVTVKDTGIGISADFLPYVFDEFRQQSSGHTRAYEGSGLGLTITKRLVDMMNGTIRIESEQGAGTTIAVSFPKYVPPGPDTPGENGQEKRRILVVEDDANTRLLLNRLLRSRYEVETARTGEQALELLKTKPVDLILLDINLGLGGDGEAILKEIRTLPACYMVPVVALTAYALPGDRERFLDAGFDAYLGKPFSTSRLLEQVEELLAKTA